MFHVERAEREPLACFTNDMQDMFHVEQGVGLRTFTDGIDARAVICLPLCSTWNLSCLISIVSTSTGWQLAECFTWNIMTEREETVASRRSNSGVAGH